MSQELIRDALRASPQATKESIARDLAPKAATGTKVSALTRRVSIPRLTPRTSRTTRIAPIVPGPPAPPVDTEMEGEKPISGRCFWSAVWGLGLWRPIWLVVAPDSRGAVLGW